MLTVFTSIYLLYPTRGTKTAKKAKLNNKKAPMRLFTTAAPPHSCYVFWTPLLQQVQSNELHRKLQVASRKLSATCSFFSKVFTNKVELHDILSVFFTARWHAIAGKSTGVTGNIRKRHETIIFCGLVEGSLSWLIDETEPSSVKFVSPVLMTGQNVCHRNGLLSRVLF